MLNYSGLVAFAAARARATVIVVAFVYGASFNELALNWVAAASRAGASDNHVLVTISNEGAKSLLRGDAVYALVPYDAALRRAVYHPPQRRKQHSTLRKRIWRQRWEAIAAMVPTGSPSASMRSHGPTRWCGRWWKPRGLRCAAPPHDVPHAPIPRSGRDGTLGGVLTHAGVRPVCGDVARRPTLVRR